MGRICVPRANRVRRRWFQKCSRRPAHIRRPAAGRPAFPRARRSGARRDLRQSRWRPPAANLRCRSAARGASSVCLPRRAPATRRQSAGQLDPSAASRRAKARRRHCCHRCLRRARSTGMKVRSRRRSRAESCRIPLLAARPPARRSGTRARQPTPWLTGDEARRPPQHIATA